MGVLARGTVVAGKYRIEQMLGAGGMGEVYLASHAALGINVALKVLLPYVVRDKQIVARFLQEAQASARIESEHVVRVSDVGRLPDGTPFMVMELLEGEDLAEMLARGGPLPPGVAVAYLLEAIAGVTEAHDLGFVHRDLKPSNLFVVRRPGKRDRVKVLDFGISKNGLDGAPQITATGATLGSPAYMSPEQVRNTKSVDVRADIWSLGVIAYELMTGKLPFPGETAGAVLAAVLSDDAVPPQSLVPAIPSTLGDVIMKCLRRAPSERFATAGELAAALAPFVEEMPALAPTAVVSRPRLEPESIAATVPADPPPATTQRSWNTQDEAPRARVWPFAAAAVAIFGIGAATLAVASRNHSTQAASTHADTAPPPSSSSEPATTAPDAPPPSVTSAPTPAPTASAAPPATTTHARPKFPPPRRTHDIFSRH